MSDLASLLPCGASFGWLLHPTAFHATLSALMAIASLSVFLAWTAYLRRRRRLLYRGMAWLGGAFLLASSAYYLADIWTLWYPHARTVLVLQGLASIPAAIAAARAIFFFVVSLRAGAWGTHRSSQPAGDRASLEAELQAKTEEMETLFALLPEAFFLLDRQGTILDGWGSAAITSTPPAELLERCLTDVLPPAAEPLLQEAIARMGGDRVECFQYASVADGSEKYFETRAVRVGAGRMIVSIRDISDRKRLERELETQKKYFQAFFENAPAGMSVLNENACYTYLNAALAEINGIPIEAHLGKSVRQVLPPKMGETVAENFRQIFEGEVALLDLEECGGTPRNPEDSRSWQSSYFLLPGEDDAPTAVGCIVTDTTERKRARLELQQREAELRNLFEGAASGMVAVTPDLQIQRANDAFCKLVGYDREELLGFNVRDLTHPEDMDADLERTESLLLGETAAFVMEKRYLCKDGSILRAELHCSLIRDDWGELLYILGVVRDIGDRKRTEQALRASQQRYAMLARVSPVGIFRTDVDGACLYVNEKWQQIAGLSMEKALGTGWLQAIYPDDRTWVGRAWSAAAIEGQAFRAEYRFQRPDGSISWVFGQASADRDEANNVLGYVGTITEISDRKEREFKRSDLPPSKLL